MRRKIVSLFLVMATAASCAYSANAAATSITVQANSVVQLGDNVVVDSNAISETDLMKKYDESKEQIASSYSNVNSNRGHLFDDLLPPASSDIPESSGNGSSTSGSPGSGGSTPESPGSGGSTPESPGSGGSTHESPGSSGSFPESPDGGGSVPGLPDSGGSTLGSPDNVGNTFESPDSGWNMPGTSGSGGSSIGPSGNRSNGSGSSGSGFNVPTISGLDLEDKTSKKSLTIEELNQLLGDEVQLPEGNPLEEYEKSLKKKLDKQRKKNKNTAEKIKDFYDKIKKGINPFTGEPFDEDDNFVDENEAARDAAKENAQLLNSPGGNGSGGGDGSSIDDQFQQNLDDMSDFMKDQYDDLLKKKKYSQVKHKKLDKSEYIDDELVYQRDNDNITDIHYRCSKCGALYGFDMLCKCKQPKYLDGTVYQYYKDNGWLSFNWGFNHFDEDGVSVDNSVFSHFVNQCMECGLCGKKLTMESIDFKADDDSKFYIGSNGVIKCHECQRKYGSDLGMNDEDITEWGDMFDPHFDDFISPCTPLLPDNSDIATDDDMFGYFLSTVPEEKREEFTNLRDTFKNGSDKDIQDAFLDTIKSEEDWVLAMNMMLMYENGGPRAAFNTFISNIPEDKRDKFKDIKEKFEAGDDNGAFNSFLDIIRGEEDWNTAGHLFDRYQNEGMDSAFEYFLENVPEENREQYREAYNKFRSSWQTQQGQQETQQQGQQETQQQGQQETQSPQRQKQENDKIIGQYAKKHCPDNNKPMDEWTADDYDEMYKKMLEDFNKAVPPIKDQKGKKIKDIKKIGDGADNTFGEWIDDPNKWTQEQWDIYDDFREEYGNYETNPNENTDKVSGELAHDPDKLTNDPVEWTHNPDEWTQEQWDMYNDFREEYGNYEEYVDDDASNIFGEWTADQDTWTQAQKDMYNDFREKYGENKTYLDMVEKGVFDPDKSPNEVSQAIDEYIAGFTSVDDKVTLVTTVDYTDIQDLGQGGSYDVKGNTRAVVTNEDGDIVAEREAVGGMPMTWVAYETGRYMVRRYVDVYHIEWSFKKCTAVMNAEVILPDGTSVAVISGYEETRIIEDMDGFKQTNCKTLEADSFSVTVVEGSINTDKTDFYDTERVK